MDERFIEQYLLNDPQLREKMWDDCIFILDANVLLNLYSYTIDTRQEFLSILKCIEPRIRFSSQVIIEFHNNRISKITRQQDDYQRIKSNINSATTKIKRANSQALQSFDEIRQLFKKTSLDYTFDKEIDLLEEYKKSIIEKLEKTKNFIPSYVSDEILNDLSRLFKNKKIKEFTASEIDKIKTEGKSRYENKIPPGYTDAVKSKKGDDVDTNEYGDLIIWKEMIVEARKEKKPVIFITDERKEDFWEMSNNSILYPRLELVKEFYSETKQFFWIYNSNKFLSHIAKYCKDITKNELDKAIQEIDQVQQINQHIGAFIIEWTTLEKDLQDVANEMSETDSRLSSRGGFISPFQIVRNLEINERWTNDFKTLNDFRNKLMHGKIFPKFEELEEAIYMAKNLVKQLNKEFTLDNNP